MFKNLTIKTRLIYLIAFLSIVLAVIGFIGLRGMSTSQEGLRTVYEDRLIAAVRLAEVNFLQRKTSARFT